MHFNRKLAAFIEVDNQSEASQENEETLQYLWDSWKSTMRLMKVRNQYSDCSKWYEM